MAAKTRSIGGIARGTLFLVSVCFVLPMILLEYLRVTLGGATTGLLA